MVYDPWKHRTLTLSIHTPAVEVIVIPMKLSSMSVYVFLCDNYGENDRCDHELIDMLYLLLRYASGKEINLGKSIPMCTDHQTV